MSEIDPRYYPATDLVEWTPLHRALCDDWMFMQADLDGCFYYKHETTRAYLVVRENGEIVRDNRVGTEHLQAAREGRS